MFNKNKIERLGKLEETVTEDKKEIKTKKGVWDRAWKKRKLEKAKTVAVLFLRENGRASPMEIKVENGFFNIEKKSYHERRDCTYIMENKERTPLAVIFEWSVTPVGHKSWYDRSIQHTFAVLQDHVMRGIRHAERVRSGESGGDGRINTKTAILIGVGVIIVLALVLGYA